MDGSIRQACGAGTTAGAGHRFPGRRWRLIGPVWAVVVKAARRVGQNVETMLGEPVVVPVPFVGVVPFVSPGFPLVLVVGEAVKHHDERVPVAGSRLRESQVHVQGGGVPARDLPGANVNIAVGARGRRDRTIVQASDRPGRVPRHGRAE